MSARASKSPSQVLRPRGCEAAIVAPRIDAKSASHADIVKQAYEKFEARSRGHGFDVEDWTAAGRELMAESFGQLDLCMRQEASQHE
jgi:hypothetical protein